MQRIYVDFGKGIDGQVDIAYTGDGPLQSVILHEDEEVILYDSSLEVHAVVHQDCSDGRTFWYAVPNWATQRNYILAPDQRGVSGG
jgi:hypothetical protein